MTDFTDDLRRFESDIDNLRQDVGQIKTMISSYEKNNVQFKGFVFGVLKGTVAVVTASVVAIGVTIFFFGGLNSDVDNQHTKVKENTKSIVQIQEELKGLPGISQKINNVDRRTERIENLLMQNLRESSQ